MAAAGPSGPGADQANDGAIAGWNTTAAPNGSWSDSIKTQNDPCPAGFRVPTHAQWQGVFANNIRTEVGSSWTFSTTNYSSGIRLGEMLFLPAAGLRIDVDGELISRGTHGNYWSSTEFSVDHAWRMEFTFNVLSYDGRDLSRGLSIRCLAV
jgi:uncharacterized protein (TIGR02145 family)